MGRELWDQNRPGVRRVSIHKQKAKVGAKRTQFSRRNSWELTALIKKSKMTKMSYEIVAFCYRGKMGEGYEVGSRFV